MTSDMREMTMPIDLPLNWSPTSVERDRVVSIKRPSLFLVFMLILFAACLLAMIGGYQHDIASPFAFASA